MKRLIIYLVVLFAFAIFAMPTHAAPPNEIGAPVIVQNEVEITNDSGNPIPVDIGTMPLVDIGTPDVHVVSMPQVDGREALQVFEDRYSFDSGFPYETSIYEVPSNKRLVIEFISVLVDLDDPDNRLSQFFIKTTVGSSVAAKHFTPPLTILTTSLSGANYQGSQQVQIYADPDTEVVIGLFSVGGCGSSHPCNISTTISGYLMQVD